MFKEALLTILPESNGIYLINGGDSAVGKTLALKYAIELREAGFTEVDAITYEEDKDVNYYVTRLMATSCKYLFIDRADLYMDENIQNTIVHISERSVIFLDMKSMDFWNMVDYKLCQMTLSKGGLLIE